MAFHQGVGVDKVVSSGVGLAFVTIPKAINSLPGPALFGTLFFLALIFAGLSSMVSICEVSIAALVEIIFLTWVCKLDLFRDHINASSDFTVGAWWGACLKFVTPAVLGYMSIKNLIGDIQTPYGGYPQSALAVFGWLVVAGIVVLSFIFQAHSLNQRGGTQ